MTVAKALDRLTELDRRLAASSDGVPSLAPNRRNATPLVDLVPASSGAADDRREALARGLFDIADAWLHNFPENIFWDLDLLARELWMLEEPAAIQRRARRIAELARAFGRATEIRFQYVHDFLYGYDWARWVARDPEEREMVGPFDADFLDYLERRQAELLDLIARNDTKYPLLAAGQARNPFGFSRTREAEQKLLAALADEGAVPVEAWHPEGRCCWDRPFSRLREEKAKALGLTS